ncbi:FAD-dependent oxidoreductase, partial [Algoriphagus aestuarii]|nr:FAD-dependent oxidoreductase [Algoriphagus aestuarii]
MRDNGGHRPVGDTGARGLPGWGVSTTSGPRGRRTLRSGWDVTKVVIIGGGPGGYEAALVAAQLGADVTVIERDGIGGASVLTDCVPSKTL